LNFFHFSGKKDDNEWKIAALLKQPQKAEGGSKERRFKRRV
jgi:hypothetical protein